MIQETVQISDPGLAVLINLKCCLYHRRKAFPNTLQFSVKIGKSLQGTLALARQFENTMANMLET